MIVLFATDGSAHSLRAIREAARLLPLKDAKLFAVAVAPTLAVPVSAGPGGLAGAALAAQGAVIDHLAKATDQAGTSGFVSESLATGGSGGVGVALATSVRVTDLPAVSVLEVSPVPGGAAVA